MHAKFYCLFTLMIFRVQVTSGLPACPFGGPPLRNSTTGDLVTCDDIEIFCPLKNSQCILDQGRNGTVVGVCCSKVAAMQQKGTEKAGEGCPKGATPMRNTFAQLVTCTTSVTNSCPALERVQCYNGMFGPICCMADNLYCPVGYDPYFYPGTMLPLVCPGTFATCPYGYQCLKSPDAGGPYACCRPRQFPAQCPNGFQPYTGPDGSPMTCIVGNPVSCPSPSVCVQSGNPFQNYCCIRTMPATLQCPNGYDTPVSGLMVACILSGVNRCPFGSSCKPSVGAPGGVCCRSLARCPSGYKEVQNPVTQEIVECSSSAIAPPTCPMGSPCLLSSTTVSSLCCTAISQCPSGYDPVQPTAQCQVDSQCPAGAQCIQSVCCRSSAVRAQCPSGYITLMDPNNNPVICAATERWCPVAQAICLQSITSASMVCCTPSQQWPQCPAGMSVTIFGGQPIPCDPANINSCPPGSSCERSLTSSTPPRICCQSITQPQCPTGMTIVFSGGQPIACDSVGTLCPSGSTCQTSVTASSPSRICCQPTETRQPQCPADMSMTLFAGQPIACDPSGVNTCPPGSTCQTSVVPSTPQRICCQPGTQPQCPTGLNLVLGTDNRPIICNPQPCPGTATCERATNMDINVCCSQGGTLPPGSKECPSGYSAQASGGQPVTCDPAATDACSNGGFCLPSLEQGELTADTICCDAIGTQCPPGFNRPDGTGTTPNTCNPSSVDPCRAVAPGAMCIGAVGTSVGAQRPFLCCQRAALCTGGRIPYYDSTYQPKTCVINRPNECASVYRCELSSTVESESVCCPRPRMAAETDDGGLVVIDDVPVK